MLPFWAGPPITKLFLGPSLLLPKNVSVSLISKHNFTYTMLNALCREKNSRILFQATVDSVFTGFESCETKNILDSHISNNNRSFIVEHCKTEQLKHSFFVGTVSESGTGPLDYGATGPVPDSEPRL